MLLIINAILLNGATFAVRPPEDFVRVPGAPDLVSRSFNVLDPTAKYTLRVTNGGIGKNFERVSSVTIAINGVDVVRQSDVNQKVDAIEREVALQSANTLSVRLPSSPGAGITVEIIGVDDSPPVIKATLDKQPNAAGWNNSDVLVSFTCSDKGSGIDFCTAPVRVDEDGIITVTGTARDKAGNTASASITVKLDKSAPEITATVDTPANAAGWNNSNVIVSFTCSDKASEDRSATVQTSPIESCSSPVTVTAEGLTQITGTARDAAGNSASTSLTIKLDKGPPLITATVNKSPNAAGWNNSDVVVSFTCSDQLSGVDTCSLPVTVTKEGVAQSIGGTVRDVAGNTAIASVNLKLDKTAPVITIASPANGATITLGVASIAVTGSAIESGSGLASVKCNGASAVLSETNFTCPVNLVQGPNSISIQATDLSGNIGISILTLTYTAAPQVRITSPVNLSVTNFTPVTVNGVINDPAATVRINGIPAPQSSGAFSMPVPLVEGLNVLTAVATNANGIAGAATVNVTLDTTPPHLTIDSPTNGGVTTEAFATVSGLVNDVVAGTVNIDDAQVTVNGIVAQVANRSYSAANVPLVLGKNTILATGRDRAGNGATTSITVTRVSPSQPPAPAIGPGVITQSLSIVSGNNQSGTIGIVLPSPIVAVLRDSSNNPVPNQPVLFKVTGNNGTVSTTGGGDAYAVVNTDTSGQARVYWTLGQRSGAGINTVEASSVLAAGRVHFAATGVTATATQIVIDSGNNQYGVTGQPLTFPFVAVVIDSGFNRVPGVPVTFSVKQGEGNIDGLTAKTVMSDSNGRVIAVLTMGLQSDVQDVVEADFSSNSGLPVRFAAIPKIPGNPANTTISGVVLDNSNNPIPGVTLRLFQTNQGNNNNLPLQVGTPVQSNAQGTFQIPSAPVGFFKLMADGATAPGSRKYPTLEYDIVTVAGIDNTVGMPIYLPVLDTVNKLCVDETHGGTLTLSQYPGFSLTVLAGSATFPGGSHQGCVSVTAVNGDKVPMAPGFGQQPRFIVSIQPAGTTFNPPAPITLPNVDGLAPRAVTEMYSYDHDLSMFVSIGTGTVTADGSRIASSPGVGVLKAGWHCGGDPVKTGLTASINLTVSPTFVTKTIDESFDVVAKGTPPLEGFYSWELLDGDPGTVTLKAPPPLCPNLPKCTATLIAKKPGRITLRVHFHCVTTGMEAKPVDVRIVVWAVDSLVFEEIDSPLDANPNPGGGQRIFPEKLTPSDTKDRKRVRVKAKVAPVVEEVEVFFKSFDVDDPSSDLAPVDVNGRPGNDNRGTPKAGQFAGGPFGEVSAVTNGDGYAIVEFSVTQQPGDNFRVAASSIEDYVDALTNVGPDLNDADGKPLPTLKGKATDMLTVWRRLHVELDSMGVATGNQVKGNITFMAPTSNTTATELTVDNSLDDGSPDLDNSTPPQNGRFEKGKITVAERTVINPIDANGKKRIVRAAGLNILSTPLPFSAVDSVLFPTEILSGTVTQIDLSGANWTLKLNITKSTKNPIDWPALIGGGVSIGGGPSMKIAGSSQSNTNIQVAATDLTIPYTLEDDDVIAGDIPEADTSGMARIWADAYIEPIFDTGKNTPDVPFALNTDEADMPSLIKSHKGVPDSTADYWVVTVLTGYQTGVESDKQQRDNDPDSEGTWRAQSFDNPGVHGVILLLESIQDWIKAPTASGGGNGVDPDTAGGPGRQPRIQEILNHEVGHLFGLTHPDGKVSAISPQGDVMAPSNNGRLVSTFGPLSLSKIRSQLHPGK